MGYNRDSYDDAWLDRLDKIAGGEDEPTDDDDELLHVAGRLTDVLSPLGELNEAAANRQRRVGARLRMQLVAASRPTSHEVWKKILTVVVAVFLFLLLGPGILFEMSPSSFSGIWPGNPPAQTLNNLATPTLSTVLLLDSGYYPASTIPVNTNSTPNVVLPIYQAHYFFSGQDVYLIRQPGNPLGSVPPGLKLITANKIKIWEDQNNSGQNILDWYEKGFEYRVISDLSVDQLLRFIADLKF